MTCPARPLLVSLLSLVTCGSLLHAEKPGAAAPVAPKLDFLTPPLAASSGAGYAHALDIPYKEGAGLSGYEKERCRLDIYIPIEKKDFPVVVWFHGGGLTAGQKAGADTVKVVTSWVRAGIAVASVNYRLSPKATFPAYIEDGAAAVAWVQKHISIYGGDAKRVFIAGHSAGAYLALMLGLDARYLKAAGVAPESIAGLIPVSGQTMTHFTVRVERGLPKDDVIADEAAPIHFARKDAPPMLLLMGGRDWPARLEENQYFAAMQKVKEHKHTHLLMIPDRTHGTIFGKLAEEQDPGREAIFRFIADPTGFTLTP